MTGGPNTILNLAFRVARLGVPVRLVTTIETSSLDPAWFRSHIVSLVGDSNLPDVPIVSAADPDQPLAISAQDRFMATHWTTAQQLKRLLPLLADPKFFYMLQEFEPSFYAWSSNYALAMETLSLDFWPIFNERLLCDYFHQKKIGRFATDDLMDPELVFEPAIEKRMFYPAPRAPSRRTKRLLFYARPSNTRNLFGLGLTALREATKDPIFSDGWEFLAIGGRGGVPELTLSQGHRLRPAPWFDYASYGQVLRDADILLCPMLSPHTSYPVLEMVACGGISVTNTFETKTLEALSQISENIFSGPATIESMAANIVRAGHAVVNVEREVNTLNMARDWDETLEPVASRIASLFKAKPSSGEAV
ncbi:MAG TPA: hypothetical protein PLZ81_18140 [Acidiphilium rubrum]|nr:hypothetical protein [Acidiphilium sp. 37-64-53]HQT86770.1 hypothetical protein [Acidiphilium rubrum]